MVREPVFLVLMMALAWAGLTEFYNLVERRGLVCFKGWGIFNGLLLLSEPLVRPSGFSTEDAGIMAGMAVMAVSLAMLG